MYDALPSLPAALASCYVLVFAYAAATVLLPSAAVAAAAGSVSELERRTVAQACVLWWRHYRRLPPRGTWAELRARLKLSHYRKTSVISHLTNCQSSTLNPRNFPRTHHERDSEFYSQWAKYVDVSTCSWLRDEHGG